MKVKAKLRKDITVFALAHSPYAQKRLQTIINEDLFDKCVTVDDGFHLKIGGTNFPRDWFETKKETLEKAERDVLKHLDNKYKYISRANGKTYVSEDVTDFVRLTGFDHLFDFIEENTIYGIGALLDNE